MKTTVSQAACGILAAMLFWHLQGGAVPAEELPEPVTLDSFMHEEFLGEHTIVYPWMDWSERIVTTDDYIPLFINGSITGCMEVYLQDGVPMLPVDFVCEALGAEPVSAEEYLSADALAELLGAEYFYYSDAERLEKRLTYSEDPHMLYNAEHVMIGKYPASAAAKTPEEAVELLRTGLITAYENQYDTAFVPTDGKPEQNFGEAWDRWRISTLDTDSILCDTDRFYVIPYVWEFYVDKYTGEVYQMYNGLTNVITRFDFTKDGALSFAG